MPEETQSQHHAEDNNFYINGEIGDSFAKEIVQPFIKEVSRQSNLCKECGKRDGLNIFITSIGGSLEQAFDLISYIEKAKSLGLTVRTYVTSMACSAGSMIAVTGSKRYVSSRAYYHLHYARGGSYSHNPEMIDRNTENAHFVQGELVKVYKKYTKLKGIEKKLLADNFMINGGEEIIRWGLADELLN